MHNLSLSRLLRQYLVPVSRVQRNEEQMALSLQFQNSLTSCTNPFMSFAEIWSCSKFSSSRQQRMFQGGFVDLRSEHSQIDFLCSSQTALLYLESPVLCSDHVRYIVSFRTLKVTCASSGRSTGDKCSVSIMISALVFTSGSINDCGPCRVQLSKRSCLNGRLSDPAIMYS